MKTGKEGSMRKSRRNGLYRREGGVFAFRYKDHAGIWREKYTGKKDRLEAKDEKDKFLRDLSDYALPNEMATWRMDTAEKWWVEFRKARIAPSTLNSERYRLQHLSRVLGNKKLEDIRNHDLDLYVTKRLEEGIGAWSINKEILLWSLILRKAKLWRRLEDDYKPLKTAAIDVGQALTRSELRQLAEIAGKNEAWEAAFYGSVLAANTGLRGGEIKKLRLGSLDVERRRLKVLREGAKTDASARWVELNADATESATRLIIRYESIIADLKVESSSDHFLLPFNCSRVNRGAEKGGLGYDPTRPQRYWDTAWASLTQAVGHTGFRFHDLRHTFISHMVERGISLGVIQAIVGHISARMLRHYTHVSSGAARKAVEILDREPILTPLCGEICGERAEKREQPSVIN